MNNVTNQTSYAVLKKNSKKLALIIAIAACLVFGLYWLAISLGFFICSYYGIKALLKRILKSKHLKVGERVLTILSIVVVSIFSQIFIFSIFSVPSDSMQKTLEINDVIFVNKLIELGV